MHPDPPQRQYFFCGEKLFFDFPAASETAYFLLDMKMVFNIFMRMAVAPGLHCPRRP
jgi:hypothetical protein